MIVSTIGYRMALNRVIYAGEQLAAMPELAPHLRIQLQILIKHLEAHVGQLYPLDDAPLQ